MRLLTEHFLLFLFLDGERYVTGVIKLQRLRISFGAKRLKRVTHTVADVLRSLLHHFGLRAHQLIHLPSVAHVEDRIRGDAHVTIRI